MAELEIKLFVPPLLPPIFGIVAMFGSHRVPGKSVLDCLRAFHLRRDSVAEKRIAVIELGMNKCSDY